MNIFLDTNVFYNDPYLKQGKKAIFNKLARHDDVRLFICKTVYLELLKAHSNFINKELTTLNNAYSKIKPYLDTEINDEKMKINSEDLIQDFKDHFGRLDHEKHIIILDYDNEILDYIVEMDMYGKPPFIKKESKKGKEAITKKEIRDAIIWYSYKLFIEKNQLKDCFFISNNTLDYGSANAKNTPEGNPYNLHPEIEGDIDITAYKTIHDFLVHNDDQVKELFTDIHLTILSEDLFEQIEDELKNGLAEQICLKYFSSKILLEAEQFLMEMPTPNLHSDYFIGGYHIPAYANIEVINFIDADIFGDSLTITLDVSVHIDTEVYLYNPAYDTRDEKFQHYDTDTIKIKEQVTFIIPINTEKEIDISNFSLEKYISEIYPTNLNIDIIEWKNINHESMFPEDGDGDGYGYGHRDDKTTFYNKDRFIDFLK